MTQEMEDILAELELEDGAMQDLARLYLPVLSRWAAASGWDAVRKWLYAYSGVDDKWYITLLGKMTLDEHREEDRRRLRVVKAMAGDNHKRIIAERAFLQKLITSLITNLIGKI